jgi:hypothetical protein
MRHLATKSADSMLMNLPKKNAKWGCTTGNAVMVAHSTKKTTSGKDSVIEGQPLLLFM